MLFGQKPWVKNLITNFLTILTILAILITRIVGKVLGERFDWRNFIGISISLVGLIILTISKKETIKNGDYFSFGSKNMSKRDRDLYRFAYVLMTLGLVFSFTL